MRKSRKSGNQKIAKAYLKRTNLSLSNKVKTAKGRKLSSTRWLERHLNDPYVQQAKLDGYRSRAAYKLLEIDQKYKFLIKNKYIIDLGAAPGGWSQVAAQKIGADAFNERIISIDYLPIAPISGVITLEIDFLEWKAENILQDKFNQNKVDVVLSDMAPPTIGHKQTDHLRIINLCEMAAQFAETVLLPGGVFVAKVFQGGAEQNLLRNLKKQYEKVSHYKPPASRQNSPETYLIGRNFLL